MFIRLSYSRLALLPCFLALAACSTTPMPKFQDELFSSGTSPFTRTFDVSSTDACEASRRALLSQGYMTTLVRPDTVDATKNFQPASDAHFTVEFHVVCTAGEDATNTSIVYVNAVQNGYALKKSDTSASVGLSVLGSLSLPIRSNSDAMVKISSETIQAGKFYDSFFTTVALYLRNTVRSLPVPGDTVSTQPLPGAQLVPPAPETVAAPALVPVVAPSPASALAPALAPSPAPALVPALAPPPAPALAPSPAPAPMPAAVPQNAPLILLTGTNTQKLASDRPVAANPASGAAIAP